MIRLPDLHVDLGAFLLGRLDDAEHETFEEHLRGCARCRAEAGALLEAGSLLQVTAPVAPPPELRDRVLEAIHRETPDDVAAVALPRRRPRRAAALAVAACAALGLAVGIGAAASGRHTTRTVTRTVRPADRQPGTLERSATLASLGDGGVEATVTITRVGTGRIVELRSTNLPKLAPSEFYELWFVAPGDAPAAPNRVSAGTFHPDSRGRVTARFLAAADPRKLPVLAVTREPRDGDPAPTTPDVLRSAG